jgi:L-lactate dehydrogenase complex protein LldG
MNAREEMLDRIRSALSPGGTPISIPRDYHVVGPDDSGSERCVELFIDRLVDYKANVHRAAPGDVAATLAAVLAGSASVVIPNGLPVAWQSACAADGRVVHVDGQPVVLTSAELDATSVVVTACRVAIAATGTVVLDAADDQGRRALTLVPDHHVVVVLAEQIVGSVPEALHLLEPGRAITFISGPSATSDIEFERVEGVHGPRTLDVIVVA